MFRNDLTAVDLRNIVEATAAKHGYLVNDYHALICQVRMQPSNVAFELWGQGSVPQIIASRTDPDGNTEVAFIRDMEKTFRLDLAHYNQVKDCLAEMRTSVLP